MVIENVLDPVSSVNYPNQLFDIKGSWVNRHTAPSRKGKKVVCRHCNQNFHWLPSTVLKKVSDKCRVTGNYHEPRTVFKDNDLNTKLNMSLEESEKIFEQLERDSMFLMQMNVMDYSLLIGIKNISFDISNITDQKIHAHQKSTNKINLINDTNQESCPTRGQNCDHDYETDNLSEFCRKKAQAVRGAVYYSIGIIDILQEWNFSKRLERFAKIYLKGQDPEGISCIEPVSYRERYLVKMRDILFEDRHRSIRIQSIAQK